VRRRAEAVLESDGNDTAVKHPTVHPRTDLWMTHKSVALTLAVLATSWIAPAEAQVREPEPDLYRFVSDTAAGGLWVNPGAAGFNRRVTLIGHYTWGRPRDEGWTTSQYLVGLQSGVLGFGYRHDEFEGAGTFSQGDAYTLSAGVAGERGGVGIARTWRTVGPADGSWELGGLVKASDQVRVGIVWRDIGSPEVRDTARDSRLIGAATLTPQGRRLSFSLQGDYRTGAGDFRAFRIGGAATLLDVVDALVVAEWDGDGDFRGLAIGFEIRQSTGTAVGVVRLDSDGDARAASAGLLANVGERP